MVNPTIRVQAMLVTCTEFSTTIKGKTHTMTTSSALNDPVQHAFSRTAAYQIKQLQSNQDLLSRTSFREDA